MTTAIIVVLLVIAAAVFIGLRYHMLWRVIKLLLAIAVVLGLVFGWKAYSGYKMYKAMTAGGPLAQTVSTAKAALQPWQGKVTAVGSLRAAKGVDISNELAGIVEELHFTSGGDVKEGTLLMKLRAEDDIAKLHALEAAARLAEITYKRDKAQLKAEAVSQATVDNDAATLDSARALAAQQKALVDKKFIRAPFSGHLGIRNVDIGQYLNPGTAIVTLQELDPIYLDFTLPQQNLADVHAGLKIDVESDTYPGKVFHGEISAVNPRVDPATRNVQMRATLKNSHHILLPGMYATAEIGVGTPTDYITLPQTAITYNPYGDTVYLVVTKEGEKDAKGNPKLFAQQTFVTVGDKRGDQAAILKGVKEGDVVVTSGQIKLQNGAPLAVNNSVKPANDENPAPQEQ